MIAHRDEICSLKTRVNTLENLDFCETDITSCEFSFGNLVDSCGDDITTIKQLLQALIDDSNANS